MGVFPFAVIRYMQGEWIAAVIDSAIVIGFVVLGAHVYRTRRVRFASIAISLFCMLGVLSTVYFIGAHQIYWIYPTLMAFFYLLRPREAVMLAVAMLVALAPPTLQHYDSHATTTIVITAIVMCSFAFAFALIANRQREKLFTLATKDPLTGAGNRRRLDDKLQEVIHANARFGSVASMLLIDLDHFKQVNDVYGHAAGDGILKALTKIVNLRIRVTDSLYRIGGEEFVVVLEGADLNRAEQLAEQLRTLVEANELVPDKSVTISLGIAQLKTGETSDDWLHRADEALYEAKRRGRNACAVAA